MGFSVQSAGSAAATSAFNTGTPAYNMASGHVVLVICHNYNTMAIPTNNAGDTFVPIFGSGLVDPAGGIYNAWWCVTNGSANYVVKAGQNSAYNALNVFDLNIVSPVLDVAAHGIQNNGGSTTVTITGVSTAVANEIMVTACGSQAANMTSATSPSGFTPDGQGVINAYSACAFEILTLQLSGASFTWSYGPAAGALAIAVSFKGATATTPTFNPPTGSYSSTQQVAISSTAGSTIYYTTDGSTPTHSSLSIASGATISVSASETVKAVASVAGYSDSAVGSAAYVISSSGNPPNFTIGTITINVSTNPPQHSVSLTWMESDTVNGYNMYRSITNGSGYTKLNSSLLTNLTYTDNTVVGGTTYYYVVTASANGVESVFSNQATAVIPTP